MKVRMFGAKKSDVFGFRFPPPQKKFWFCVNLGDRHVLAWLINLSDNQHIN